jgi:hypothetical protein
MSFGDDVLRTRVRLPTSPPGIMNLEKSLKVASHLARCDNAIRKLKDNQPLEDKEQSWVFNLFNMDWNSPHQEDKGKIAFMIFGEAKDQAETLLSLGGSIVSDSVSKEDWTFILNGLIRYRRFLINKSHECNCGCDI